MLLLFNKTIKQLNQLAKKFLFFGLLLLIFFPNFDKIFPVGNYMFKVNNRNTRTRCEGVFIIKFEHISHLALVSIVKFEQVTADWVSPKHKIF